MRKVFRTEDNAEYWDRRWTETSRDPDAFTDLTIYPIKFAEMVMRQKPARSLELGAGLGRVTKHYWRQGLDMSALERSEVAVSRLKEECPGLDVRTGDVRSLPYRDEEFDAVLAFGLFHNLEEGLDDAIAETARCVRRGGAFCISMRPDNIEMRLNEWYWRRRNSSAPSGTPKFHKWLVRAGEFRALLQGHGLRTAATHTARNVSILYRLPALRAVDAVNETDRRAGGYRLNALGCALDRALTTCAPSQFCNVLVFVGNREA